MQKIFACLMISVLVTAQVSAATPIEALKKVGVEVVPSPYVQTEQDSRIVPQDQHSVSDDINFWKEKLQYQDDRTRSRYIVIPKLGVVAPINNIYDDNPDFEKIKKGKSFQLNKYLQTGILRYPMTATPGRAGNMVLFGHSSYFKSDRGRYKTIFTTIALLEQGDKIRIYVKKDGTDTYIKHEYHVFKGFIADANDLSVMKPTEDATLTLVGCTPIGTADDRYIIKAKLTSHRESSTEDIQSLVLPTQIPDATQPDAQAPLVKEISVIGDATATTDKETPIIKIEDSAASIALIDQHNAASEEPVPSEVSVKEDMGTSISSVGTGFISSDTRMDISDTGFIAFNDAVISPDQVNDEINFVLLLPTQDIVRINNLVEQIHKLPIESQIRIKNKLTKYFIRVQNRMATVENHAGYMKTVL